MTRYNNINFSDSVQTLNHLKEVLNVQVPILNSIHVLILLDVTVSWKQFGLEFHFVALVLQHSPFIPS